MPWIRIIQEKSISRTVWVIVCQQGHDFCVVLEIYIQCWIVLFAFQQAKNRDERWKEISLTNDQRWKKRDWAL